MNNLKRKELWENATKAVLKNSDFLTALYSRWQDEKSFEDFKEYETVIKNKFNQYKVADFKKRPFSFSLKLEDSFFMFISINNKSLTTKARTA